MKKIDLHSHLNGVIPTKIIKKIIKKNKIFIPKEFNLDKDLQVLKPAKSLVEYFKPWEVLKKIPIGFDMLNIMVNSALEKLKEDNITYVEFRNSPFYISKLNNISLEESIHWLVNSISENSKQVGISSNLILSITRHEYNVEESFELLKVIKKINSNKIVGVDLSGNEDSTIDSNIIKFFRDAKEELGLGITIHAGETGNPKNIDWAIEKCKADRIGHGISAIKSKKTIELIKENNVCLEVSIISNLRTNAITSIEEHPIKQLIEKNIPIVLCSDNPSVHGCSLSNEYEYLYKIYPDYNAIKKINLEAKKY